MIQAFDRVYFKAHIVGTSMHCIGIEFKVQGNVFQSLPSPTCTTQHLPLNKWTKVSVTVKSNKDSSFDLLYYLFTPSLGTQHHFYQSLSVSDLYLSPFSPSILLGGHSKDESPFKFPGGFREIVFLSIPLGFPQLQQDGLRTFRGGGLDTYQLLAYFPNATLDKSKYRTHQQ